jgi:hypothetical protein
MIKVQPARSRIVKTEGPDRLRLEQPPPGLLSVGGCVVVLSLAWAGLAGWGGAHALHSELKGFAVIAGVAMIPALLVLFAGAVMCRKRWTIERSAERIDFERRGLFVSARKRWNAQDVSKFYIQKSPFNDDTLLLIGFRNGRSEEVMLGKSGEEMQWVATMLSDPRGTRRAAPQAPLQTPATPRVRADESIVPASLKVRKDDAGVTLSFLALIHFKRRWWKLLGKTLLWSGAIVAAALVGERFGMTFPVLTRIALGVVVLTALGRILVLHRTAAVQIQDGIVSIVQNQLQGNHQFTQDIVEFVQTFRGSGETELQFLRRGQPKLRLFGGRPAEELEWAARFLRVALKSRSEAAATVKVDAAQGECQVCGEKTETRVVFCAKCRTPHHEECWTYVGTCSTYGCREIRFTRS